MTIKGSIQPNHIALNNYQLLVAGMPEITFTKVGEIEEEVEKVDLPDRTQASGGNTKPGETTASVPMHHVVQIAAMEAWFKEGQAPVTATYKKAATLVFKAIDGAVFKSYSLTGLWITKRKLPSGEMNNAGEMAEVEFTLAWDDVHPI